MKKIMFNDQFDLTQKVLSGQKTMTRREMLSHKPKYHIGEIVAIAQCYKMICKDFVDSSVGAKEFKTRDKKAKALLSQYRDSIALHLMKDIGVDTTDWNVINKFCKSNKIAGKPFRELSPEDLDEMAMRLRMILKKKERL